jgi:toxin HigB-1
MLSWIADAKNPAGRKAGRAVEDREGWEELLFRSSVSQCKRAAPHRSGASASQLGDREAGTHGLFQTKIVAIVKGVDRVSGNGTALRGRSEGLERAWDDSGSGLAVCTISTSTRWSCEMIVSLRDDWLRDLLWGTFDQKKIPPDLEAGLFRKLQMIDDATTDQDLRAPPSNHSRSCAAIWQGSIRSVSISNGGLSSAEGAYLDNHAYG